MKDIRYTQDSIVNERVTVLVASEARVSTKQFPQSRFPNFDFESPRWDLNEKNLSWQTHPKYAHFFNHCSGNLRSKASLKSALQIENAYINVVKAWIIDSNVSAATMVSSAQAARELWRALVNTSSSLTDKFRWDKLTPMHMADAANYTTGRVPGSAAVWQSSWLSLTRWLVSNEVLPDSFVWHGRQSIAERNAGRKDRAKLKLPQRHVLEALATIYQQKDLEATDRLLISCVGLLLVCGFRLSELLTLPVDCLIEEKRNGKKRYGIRYWNRKTADDSYKAAVRWLSPLGAELAIECLESIKKITLVPRLQARQWELHPNLVPNFGYDGKALVSNLEAAKLLSIVPKSLPPLIRAGSLRLTPVVGGYHKWFYKRREIHAELVRRQPPLRTLQISGSKYQMLSETLLVCFVYATDRQASTSNTLVRSLPASSLNIFLGCHDVVDGEKSNGSAFARLLRGSSASKVKYRLHSHQMRHWLNTVANRAGMSAFLITVWMGRRSISQTRLYLHDSDDIANLTSEYLRDGKMVGKRAEMVGELDEDNKIEFLSRGQLAHVTAAGICLETLPRDCKRMKLCDLTCPMFLAVKGDVGTVKPLEVRKQQLAAALDSIRDAQSGGGKIVSRQAELFSQALHETEKLLLTVTEAEGPSAA